MVDDHVDRWRVEARQRVKLSHTNRSMRFESRHAYGQTQTHTLVTLALSEDRFHPPSPLRGYGGQGGSGKNLFPDPWPLISLSPAASAKGDGLCLDDLVVVARVPHPIHPELGRETPQRRWYCVLRRGRVGRRQVF